MFGKSSRRRKGDARIMIKIIELGTIRKQKCQRCGCLFSYENEDVITERNEHMLLGFHKIYINCPQCEQKIVLGVY